jgi:hypothetical protein
MLDFVAAQASHGVSTATGLFKEDGKSRPLLLRDPLEDALTN